MVESWKSPVEACFCVFLIPTSRALAEKSAIAPLGVSQIFGRRHGRYGFRQRHHEGHQPKLPSQRRSLRWLQLPGGDGDM